MSIFICKRSYICFKKIVEWLLLLCYCSSSCTLCGRSSIHVLKIYVKRIGMHPTSVFQRWPTPVCTEWLLPQAGCLTRGSFQGQLWHQATSMLVLMTPLFPNNLLSHTDREWYSNGSELGDNPNPSPDLWILY